MGDVSIVAAREAFFAPCVHRLRLILRRSDPRFWVAATAAAVVIAFWTTLLGHWHQEATREIGNATVATGDLTRAFEEHVVRIFDTANEAALVLRAEFQRKGMDIDIPALRRAGLLAGSAITGVGIVGPDGRVLAKDPNFHAAYLDDWDSLRTHLGEGADAPYIGKPVFDQVSGKWSIFLVRRLAAADRNFRGAVAVQLEAGYFLSFYDPRENVDGLRLTLIGRDGIVRVRYRDFGAAGDFGRDHNGGTLLQHAAISNTGSYVNASRTDGITRVHSYRTLTGYPLVVGVAMASAAFSGGRSRDSILAILFTGFGIIVSTLLIRSFSRQIRITEALRERERRRSEAEESLRQSEARFRTLFAEAPVAIAVATLDGTIIDANPTYLKMFRLDNSEEIRGANVADVYDPSLHAEVSALNDRWRNGEIIEHHWLGPRIRRDGSRFDTDTRALLMRFPDQVVRVAFSIDVTKSRRVQAELQRAKDRLDLALRGAQVAIWDIDCSTGTVVVGDQWAAMLGEKPGQRHYQVRDFFGMIHPEDERRAKRETVALLKGIDAHLHHHYRVRANGDWIWISVRAKVIERDATGRARRVAGTVEDVSAHKRAEQALRESETRFRQLVEGAIEGIAISRDGILLDGNPQLAAILGWELPEMIGRPVADFIAPESRDLVAHHVRARYEGQYEHFLQRRNGAALPVRSHARMMSWQGTEFRVTVIEDISERQENIARISALSRRLIEVQEEERRKLARELHDEIGQVLTAVRLNLKLIERLDQSGALQEAVRDGLVTVERAIGQVRGMSLDLRPPLLDELGLVPALRWLAQQHETRSQTRITVEAEPDDIELPTGVALACYRVAQEALTNAARHADASEVSVHLDRQDSTVSVAVRDDGRGFDPSRIRVKNGLGLLGMEERVKLAGGVLQVQSRPGAGTEVRAHFITPS